MNRRAEDVACRLEDDFAMISMNLAGVYPEALAPDPNALTVDEIRLLKLTPDEWRVLGEAESAGKARKSVLALAAERGATANGTA